MNPEPTWKNYNPNSPWKTAVRVGAIFASIHGLLATIAISSQGESMLGWIVGCGASLVYYLLTLLGIAPVSIVVVIAVSVLGTGCVGALLGLAFRAIKRR